MPCYLKYGILRVRASESPPLRSLDEPADSASSRRIENPAPVDYITPDFPSLYWPFEPRSRPPAYLYYTSDVWRFTILWTLIVYAAVYFTASVYAVFVNMKHWKFLWMIPLVYAFVGGLEAVLAGSFVGLV